MTYSGITLVVVLPITAQGTHREFIDCIAHSLIVDEGGNLHSFLLGIDGLDLSLAIVAFELVLHIIEGDVGCLPARSPRDAEAVVDSADFGGEGIRLSERLHHASLCIEERQRRVGGYGVFPGLGKASTEDDGLIIL